MTEYTIGQTSQAGRETIPGQEAPLALPANPIRPRQPLFTQLVRGSAVRRQLLTRWGEQAWMQLEASLARHPFVQERATFPKRYTYALWYLVVTAAQAHHALPRLPLRDLARQLHLPPETLRCWTTGLKRSDLLESLDLFDKICQQRAATLPPETLSHTRLGFADLYETFRCCRQPIHRTADMLSRAVERFCRTYPNPPYVIFADFRPYWKTTTHWLHGVATALRRHRAEVETLLNRRLGAEMSGHETLRVAVINTALYLWRRNGNPCDCLNIYPQTYFHFRSREAKLDLIKNARRHLNIRRPLHLSHLLRQITAYDCQSRDHSVASRRPRGSRLEGETLHFLLDATNQPFDDIKRHLRRVGIFTDFAELDAALGQHSRSLLHASQNPADTHDSAREPPRAAPVKQSVPPEPVVLANQVRPIGQWEHLMKELSKKNLKEVPLMQEGRKAWKKLEAALSRHPFLRDHVHFQLQYERALCCLLLVEAQQHGTLTGISARRLAHSTGIPEFNITSWLRNGRRPFLVRSLATLEAARITWQASLPREASVHCLNPSYVYGALRSLRNPGNFDRTLQVLAGFIIHVHRAIPSPPRLLFAELHPYHPSGPQWLKRIADFIQTRRRDLEELLNMRLRSDQMRSQAIRVGIVRHRLYLWRRDTQEDNWLNLYGQETFYLRSYEARKTLIDDARSHLHLGARHLSCLIKQITNYPGRIIHQLGRIADLSGHHTRFKGETLHLLLDATDRTLSQIRPTISHIGGTSPRGQIYKPQFPTIEPLRTRLLATMLSDGHLARDGALVFTKADPSRRQLVKEMLAQLGEVRFQKSPSQIVLRMPTLLGRLLKKWGMPVGDKPLQDVRLPPSIREGSIIIKCAYLEEVIPEDGSFIFKPRVKRGMFQIARNIAIRAGQKEERYPLQTGFSSKDLQFLQQWGVSRSSTLSNHPHGFTAIHLTYGRLQRLTQSSDGEVAPAARRLQQLILSRPCQLLVDEVRLCRSLGIGVRANPTAVRLYLPSGRVSVTWQTQTTRKEDALRFGLLAPPHDHRHRAVFLQWAASEPRLVEKIRNQLRREGLELRLSNLT